MTNETKVLSFAAGVEIGTGLVLMVVPVLAVELLLGSKLSSDALPLCRVAGIAMLALGLASWPSRAATERRARAFWGMLAYNALVGLYLAHLGAFRHVTGLLLWPAVALHLVVALLLLWTSRRARS